MLPSRIPFRFRPAVFHATLAFTLAAAVTIQAQDMVTAPPDVALARPTNATEAERVVIVGRADDLVGVATSSSEGIIGAADLSTRPIFRPAEVMETIPGVIVTQHSGSGKANQYFLRGFNLDHGTDLATDFEGMPINLRSHAHGQGYTDLNFLIPELVSQVAYKKGNYYAGVGDFGSAGAFSIRYFDTLPGGSLAKVEGGDFGFARALFATSPQLGPGHLLAAFEIEHNDGPWDNPDDYQKFNGVVRYSVGDDANGASLNAIAYHGQWNSTDQIAERAVRQKLISRFGTLNGTDGGDSSRYSLNGNWHRTGNHEGTRVEAYGYYYDLDLFSDFTYFLDDPVNGDQFEQKDRRVVLGLDASQYWDLKILGFDTVNTVGIQERTDFIRNGLFHTAERVRLSTTRADHIVETSVGPYLENKTAWLPWLRTVAGFRADVFTFHDDDLHDHVSGDETAAIVSPKFSLILGPWYKTEFYLNGGYGLHSNDVRGAVGPPIPGIAGTGNVDPLVKSKGAEFGVRTTAVPNLQTSVTLWILDLDSELVFAGDSASNEPSRASRRWGVEFASFYTPTPWLTADVDAAWSEARFTEKDPAGPYVPEAVGVVLDAGVAVHDLGKTWLRGFYGGLRFRYFGPRTLIEDDSQRSKSTSLVYLQLGYRFDKTWDIGFDVFNVLDSQDADIDYYYTSRLQGEPAEGVNDRHTHQSEPREFRGMVTARF